MPGCAVLKLSDGRKRNFVTKIIKITKTEKVKNLDISRIIFFDWLLTFLLKNGTKNIKNFILKGL